MIARTSAALCGAAIAIVAFAAQAATDYSTAKLPAPVGKVESVAGTSVKRIDKAMDALVAPGAKIERIAHGFVFTEGSIWHKGETWFSDLRGNKVWSVTPAGKLTLRLDHAGGVDSFDSRYFRGSNALVNAPDGGLLLAQHSGHRIVKLDDAMRATSFIDKYQGKALSSPNDMVYTKDGALYFTDPPFFYADPNDSKVDPNKQPGKVQKTNNVYRYKDGKLTAVITDIPLPNGVALSPDDKVLYVADTVSKLYRFDVKADGSVANKRLFADLSKEKGAGVPDGVKVDSRGNVWTSGPAGIHVFSPDGRQLGQIVLPEVAANLAFGGDDMKTLYITGSTSIYKVPVLVAGEKPMYTR